MIYNSFFSADEVTLLKSNVDTEINKRVLSQDDHFPYSSYNINQACGRKVASFINIDESLKLKIYNEILKNYSTASLMNVVYAQYSNQYGVPLLEMHQDGHVDANSKTICFDYQLESNTSWDLIVGNQNYSMSDNDAVLFDSSNEMHGRPNKTFADGEFITNLFFFFNVI